jgi:hypothetical protein
MNNPFRAVAMSAAILAYPNSYPVAFVSAFGQLSPLVVYHNLNDLAGQMGTLPVVDGRGNGLVQDSNPRSISVNQSDYEIEKTFNTLATRWKSETTGYSSVGSMVMHPAYLEIISYGAKMIPFILRDLQTKPSHWFIALKTLAKTSPVRPEDAGNIKKMTDAWLEWGKANGKLH